MSLKIIPDTLLTVTDKVYHHRAPSGTKNYIVWAERMQNDGLWADNTLVNQTIIGTIDFYSTKEYDSTVDNIQKALNEANIWYSLDQIDYIEEYNSFHYQWRWQIECGVGSLYT